MVDPTSWSGMFAQYGRSLLWAITAAIGFGLGVGISLKVFDWLSTDIDEWEEIKKGNMGVSLIFVSILFHPRLKKETFSFADQFF